ncbi:hypothetical protein JCM10207_000300 [Rhodosporidiobolus poonsookiae]
MLHRQPELFNAVRSLRYLGRTTLALVKQQRRGQAAADPDFDPWLWQDDLVRAARKVRDLELAIRDAEHGSQSGHILRSAPGLDTLSLNFAPALSGAEVHAAASTFFANLDSSVNLSRLIITTEQSLAASSFVDPGPLPKSLSLRLNLGHAQPGTALHYIPPSPSKRFSLTISVHKIHPPPDLAILFDNLPRSLPHLKYLSIDTEGVPMYCHSYQHDSFGSVFPPSIYHSFPSLLTLTLQNARLSLADLESLAASSPRLEHLDLRDSFYTDLTAGWFKVPRTRLRRTITPGEQRLLEIVDAFPALQFFNIGVLPLDNRRENLHALRTRCEERGIEVEWAEMEVLSDSGEEDE